MKCLVTGGAGFIGSNLVDELLSRNHEVIAYDNLSTGVRAFLADADRHHRFRFVAGDLLDRKRIAEAMAGVDIVFHLAANADVRYGALHPEKDVNQNILATFSVLEAMRQMRVLRIAFASTGSIYGDATIIPTPEDAPFPVQNSLYGASKLAAEGLIAAFCEAYGMQAWIFRFVSVLGPRYTHGHVFDFLRKLTADPHVLHVLGDGQQRKSYMAVSDCVAGVLLGVERSADRVNIYNLGIDSVCTVDQSARWICERLGVDPQFIHAGGARGWIGDVPHIHLDVTRIRGLGWEPRFAIKDGVLATLDWLIANRWILQTRS